MLSRRRGPDKQTKQIRNEQIANERFIAPCRKVIFGVVYGVGELRRAALTRALRFALATNENNKSIKISVQVLLDGSKEPNRSRPLFTRSWGMKRQHLLKTSKAQTQKCWLSLEIWKTF